MTNENSGDHTIATPTNSRDAFVATLFSLFFPGLGQLYNGQIKKAVAFFAIILMMSFVIERIRITTSFYGLIALIIAAVSFRIYIIVDSIIHAKRQKYYTLKKYNRWYIYILFTTIASIVLFVSYNNSSLLGVRIFKIPTIAHCPTIQSGDCIVADKRAYENHEPDYGDIVTFEVEDGMYLFRIVGLPYDKIEMENNVLKINDKSCEMTFMQDAEVDGFKVSEFEEVLPNGHKHRLYTLHERPDDDNYANIKSITIPRDHYYVLGDNRDNAYDSRYMGFISRKQIIGQVIYSCWGATTDRVNVDFRDK